MLFLDRQSVASSQSGAGASRPGWASHVHLRLRAAGQLFELPPGKTTIGSSPRCNVRIQQPGIQPLHCLIVHGLEGLSVRRWAGETRINGEPFEDAPLADGDCLTLGGVELELIGPGIETGETLAAESQQAATCDDAICAAVSDQTNFNDLLLTTPNDCPASAQTPVSDAAANALAAAEIVLHQLQQAMEISRGRSRKLVSALRHKRKELAGVREQLGEVEQQFAAAAREQSEWNEGQTAWNKERAEWDRQQQQWRLQVADWEKRLADQVRQMNELHELAAMWAAEGHIEIAGDRVLSPVLNLAGTTEATKQLAAVFAETSEMNWASDGYESSDLQSQHEDNEPAAFEVPSVYEPSVGEFQSASRVAHELPSSGETTEENDEFDACKTSPCSAATSEEIEATNKVAAIGDESATELTDKNAEATPVRDDALADRASKPRVAQRFEESATESTPALAAWRVAADMPASAMGESAPSKRESVSFIERFSHMFTDDNADELQPVVVASQISASEAARLTAEAGAARASDAEAEESIEQYMANLLQRMRGDSSTRSAAVVPATTGPLNTPGPLQPANEPIGSDAEFHRPTSRGAAKQKGEAAAPTTNLGALRALANETARRAISRHELRKLRRNAVTKVIVSTLAGVTSLWLMLDSPDWRDVQFIIACVSLLVAAYWAGETYRTLLEALRTAASDGPQSGLDEAEVEYEPALPIDVEERP